ncbi:hypothetical protein [Aristaeella hokkaidonensis]|uniref:Uncharacterized protein n=1 Tax=Aristaeella hokkaidonensis TaxID=3046382 RepID=A0AC61MYH9_9FIRM|nr:hypothetical protein [Aristaeella hokkaidonensis]QUC68180.1 hypothetical protein JYE49_05665 [Aristaeella hokkaidonensis]
MYYFTPRITPIPIINKTPSSINITQAAVTALFAVVSGFILYIIKTIIDEKYLRQRRDYLKLKADISYALMMYANIYMNLPPRSKSTDEASKALRDCGARLGAFLEEWPKIYRGIPDSDTLKQVHQELIRLSNQVFDSEIIKKGEVITRNGQARQKIKELLQLKDI